MIRRPSQSVVANPVLVGATTVLVVIVAVFLAYSANEGLPFVPTRNLTVDMPSAQNLVEQNEVREGGHRIGIVTKMDPVHLPNGRIGARLFLKLDRDVPAVPVDSSWAVRPRSALSLKYLELERGRSHRTLADGARVSADHAHNPVELDELVNTFDRRTRQGQARLVKGSGEMLYARGADINRSIGQVPRFLRHLQPVMRTLAEPSTGLRTFIRELDDGVRVLAPISRQWAEGFQDGATTFEAISRDDDALEQTVAKTPPTLRVGETTMRAERPFLRDLAAYSTDLERASHQVRRALPPINRALGVGTPVQRASVPLSERAEDTLVALSQLTTDPLTNYALRGLAETTRTLNVQLRYFGPIITVCNTWNFFWTFAGEHLSERDPTGTSQRTISMNGDQQDNSLTNAGAILPANGEHVQPGGVPQYFHGQAYARGVDEQGNADCEVGQRGFLPELSNKFAPKAVADRFKHVISPSTPRTPGSQGPNFDQIVNGKGVGLGPKRVPPGMTYTAEPQTGAQIP